MLPPPCVFTQAPQSNFEEPPHVCKTCGKPWPKMDFKCVLAHLSLPSLFSILVWLFCLLIWQFIFLDTSQWPEGSYKIGFLHPSACPSIHPTVCLCIFLELYDYFFLKFGMVLETHMNLCMTAGFSWKKFLASKFGKIDWKWAKNRVFWIYGKIW